MPNQTYETINFSIENNIATIELNRPDKLNAFSKTMHNEFYTILKKVASNDDLRCVVITGAGRGFCAGQDLGERKGGEPMDLGETLEKGYNTNLRILKTIRTPIVCAVNGVAAGAGANIALNCDIVVATESANFIQSFSQVGLVPDCNGSWILPKLIGMARAKAITMLAEPVTAKIAEQWGMIYACYADDSYVESVKKLVDKVANRPTLALANTKELIEKSYACTYDEQLDNERDVQRIMGLSHDFNEGVTAFGEKKNQSSKGVRREFFMLLKFKNIGVIGAGTMGIGIAEVAASHNQKVYLFDLNIEFANTAKQNMSLRLNSRVERGKITAEHRQQIIDNIVVVNELNKLSTCQLVIEAIVEKLNIKQNVFKELQEICKVNTLFASNTSSISITAIAAILDKPENMIGLHFFNPAPVMQLVEVVAGMRSSQESLNNGLKLCQFWNKTAVLAQSSPGFIVNRVARPFYGESLKMLQEQVASPITIDTLMTSVGFRMGPFTLMDLIGMDINLSVSETVFKSMYYDARYRPSLIQGEMVSANLLGKKSGQGFYKYDGSQKPVTEYEAKQEAAKYISISKDLTQLNVIENKIKANKHFIVTEHIGGASIQVDECAILLSNGQTCNQRLVSIPAQYLAQLDLMLDFETCAIIHLSFDSNCPLEIRNQIIGMFQVIGKNVIVCTDLPALVVMRTVCLLINEAADAIENGVCSENDVDLAMQKGVNYPIGLLAWAHKIGINHVVETLDHLHQWFGDDRYRVSPWLRRHAI